MAKLTGVKTIDMVNGEITKIAYDGAEYAKVANDFKDAQTGDIFFYDGRDAYYEILIRESDFYGIPHPVRFKDDDGSDNGYMRGCSIHPLFRKISADTAPTLEAVAEKVDEIDKRVSVLEGVTPASAKTAQTIEHIGGTYTLVSRKAQPGDVVVLTETGGDYFKTEKPYEVLDGVKIADGGIFDLYKDNLGRTEATVLVYESVKEALKVGDYAVVISSSDEGYGFGGKVGDVVEIEEVDSSDEDLPYRTRKIGGKNYNGTWAPAYYLRKATDAEVAEATALSKPKTGDIVVITANTNSSDNAVGEIGKVGEAHSNGKSARVEVEGRPNFCNWTRYNEMRLATPAEIVRYEAAVKPKFAEGDYARTLANGENGDLGEGIVVKVDSTDCGTHGDPYSIYVETIDEEDGDYFRPQDLEKLDGKALVFAKSGRKVNEYKAGDVVRYTGPSSAKGMLVDVVEDSEGNTTKLDFGRRNFGICTEHYRDLEPIAFVESRVDRV